MQLSFLVHPDKNRDDSERAQKAFEGEPTVLGLAGYFYSLYWAIILVVYNSLHH